MSMYVVRVLTFGNARTYTVCEVHRRDTGKLLGTVVSVKYAPQGNTECDLCEDAKKAVS